jgi:hypothetical protein
MRSSYVFVMPASRLDAIEPQLPAAGDRNRRAEAPEEDRVGLLLHVRRAGDDGRSARADQRVRLQPSTAEAREQIAAKAEHRGEVRGSFLLEAVARPAGSKRQLSLDAEVKPDVRIGPQRHVRQAATDHRSRLRPLLGSQRAAEADVLAEVIDAEEPACFQTIHRIRKRR